MLCSVAHSTHSSQGLKVTGAKKVRTDRAKWKGGVELTGIKQISVEFSNRPYRFDCAFVSPITKLKSDLI